MIKIYAGLAVLLVLGLPAQAEFAPDTSPIPKFRSGEPVVTPKASHNTIRSPIPRLRSSKGKVELRQDKEEIAALVQIAEHDRQKQSFRTAAVGPVPAAGLNSGVVSIKRSLIPRLRPIRHSRAHTKPRVIASRGETPRTSTRKERRVTSRRGSVCGVRSIKGTSVARINGSGGCGIANPVKITEVAGVALTREMTVNCTTAKRLDNWVSRSAKPTIGRKGGGLSEIQIIGGYSCRSRSSKRGAKLSEHAVGNAIDIAGFKLQNGTIYSVKRDWRRGRRGRTLRRLHKSACGQFGTVLGPNADRQHKDHFHFDIARHRSGAYCR